MRRHPPPWRPAPEPTEARLALDAVVELASSPLRAVDRLARALRPQALPTSVAEVVGMAHLGEQLAHLELGLNGPIGPRRDWRWVRADLDAVKAVKNHHGGTVNDVVLAAVAGGFRSLLLSRGRLVDGRSLRTMVPVSTRHADEHGTLGNRVSAVFADLPIGLADPLDRLHAVTAQLHALKNSGTALGADALLGAADLLPGEPARPRRQDVGPQPPADLQHRDDERPRAADTALSAGAPDDRPLPLHPARCRAAGHDRHRVVCRGAGLGRHR